MTHFLSRLAARAVGLGPTAGPRRAARFDLAAGVFSGEIEGEADDSSCAPAVTPGRAQDSGATDGTEGVMDGRPVGQAIPSRNVPGPSAAAGSLAGKDPATREHRRASATAATSGALARAPSSGRPRPSAGAVSAPRHDNVASNGERGNVLGAAPAPPRTPTVAVPASASAPAWATATPAPPTPAGAADGEVADPVVRISIGRVEVRANLVATPQPSPRRAEESGPDGAGPMPLHDYLRGRRRDGNARGGRP